MRLLERADWLQRVIDVGQEAALAAGRVPDPCPTGGDPAQAADAARTWLAGALEERVSEDHRLLELPTDVSWVAATGQPLASVWNDELLLVGHLTELVMGLRAHFAPTPRAADEQDALVALVLARRELLLSVVRLLGKAWLDGRLDAHVAAAIVAVGRSIRKRLGPQRSPRATTAGVAPMALADELAAAAEAALYILERRAVRQHRDLQIGTLDGEQRVALASVLAALAWADGKLRPEEEHTFREQLVRLHLTPSERKQAWAALRSRNAALGDVATRLRGEAAEFTLERAIWTSLVDGDQAAEELALIDELAQAVGLSRERQAQIEDRVLRWFERDHLLLGVGRPAGGGLLYLRVQQRIAQIVRLNLRRLMKEVQETGELSMLLVKAGRGQALSTEEKRKVAAQLLDIAKTIPALAVFALPGGGILLPVLLKLLPFNLLPSAFTELTEE